MGKIPQPIKDLATKSLSKTADRFVDFVIKKYTGRSIKAFEAEAEIEADKIKSKWELLEKPYWLQAEAVKMNRQYSNLGTTLKNAAPLITATENTITNDNDFFWGLLEHSKEISNDEMQQLIAKIVAGEYNAQGSYSMSTLQIIKSLGKKELDILRRLGTLIVNGFQIPHNLFALPESAKSFMTEINVDFGSLQTLQSLGLFMPNEMITTMPNPERKKVQIMYFGNTIIFSPASESINSVDFPGFYGLSESGKQILKHLNCKENKEYYVWLKENYKIPGYKVIES